jgi:hypothetical protein
MGKDENETGGWLCVGLEFPVPDSINLRTIASAIAIDLFERSNTDEEECTK